VLFIVYIHTCVFYKIKIKKLEGSADNKVRVEASIFIFFRHYIGNIYTRIYFINSRFSIK